MDRTTLAARIVALFNDLWPTTEHHVRTDVRDDVRVVVQVMSQDRMRTFCTVHFLPRITYNAEGRPTQNGYNVETSLPGFTGGVSALTETAGIMAHLAAVLTRMSQTDLIQKGV